MKSIVGKTFYFVRHGQTDANKNKQMCGGDWDVELNSEGLNQAKLLTLKNKTLLESFKTVYVSPMRRAIQTAKVLVEEIEVKFAILEELREWRVGDWESKPWEEVPNPFETEEDPPNGESRLSFEERVVSIVSDTLESSDEGPILFVSHGAVAHTLFTYLNIDVPYIRNATIYKIESIQDRWKLTEL